jgi:hypothetical protein
MAPWTLFLQAIEDLLYTAADRLSALLPGGGDVEFAPVNDPFLPPES